MHTPLSTQRVQKHRENKKLTVDINFKSSNERKSKYLSKKVRNAVATVSPKSKANSISKLVTSQSPKTKDAIMSNLKKTENPISMQVFYELKNKRDRLSKCARKLIMKPKKGIQKQRNTSTFKNFLLIVNLLQIFLIIINL